MYIIARESFSDYGKDKIMLFAGEIAELPDDQCDMLISAGKAYKYDFENGADPSYDPDAEEEIEWRLYPTDDPGTVSNGDSLDTYEEHLDLSAWNGEDPVEIIRATSNNEHITTLISDGIVDIRIDNIYNAPQTVTVHAETDNSSIEFTVTFLYD